jgi:cyclophilin family peptidyl-prolyl cis-trans isomerase
MMPANLHEAPSMRRTILLASLLSLPLATLAQEPIEVSATPRVRVITTKGDFVIELDRTRAPLTVETFLQNVASGFYADTIFHRVIGNFVAQAGGYTTDMELKPTTVKIVNESGNGLSNLRGTVGLARGNDPHSASGQFYINLADNLDLNPRPTRWGYAVFGKVVEGMEVVDGIGQVPTGASGNLQSDVPVTPIVIESMVLLTD